MVFSISSEPVWIETPESFQEMLKDIHQQNIIAIDTESNSLYVYHEQVCLIQISTFDKDYLIDSLTLKDISDLGGIFASPDIEKVFHAAEYDLIGLTRDYQFKFANLFDTSIAGRILGYQRLGLDSILKEYFDLVIDKKYQRANWGKRPLTPEMLAYARMDSHYLIDLRNKMKDQLKSIHRWELAQEDFRRMCHVQVPDNGNALANCWRAAKNHPVSPQQAAVLYELCKYRDKVAKQANLPLFKILSNKVLLEIALLYPRSNHELERVPGLSQKNIYRHGAELLRAVKLGLEGKPLKRENGNRPSEAYRNRLEILHSWRKEKGISLNVASDVILPKDVMNQIAAENPKTFDELSEIMNEVPSRLNAFGSEILGVLMINS
jgi:ribonuclease D